MWQVVGANKGGVVAEVEGLRGFVPFSQIPTVSHLEPHVLHIYGLPSDLYIILLSVKSFKLCMR